MDMRKSKASFSFTWPISVAPPIVGSSLSLSGVRDGVDGVELFLLGMFLGGFEGLNKCLRERRGEPESDGDEEGDEVGESLKKYDAGLSVTQSDDPLSGGHFVFGVLKAPPRPSRHRPRVIVHVLHALEVGHGKHVRLVVVSESPIPNGLTTVAV
jgi:hypothetical protein